MGESGTSQMWPLWRFGMKKDVRNPIFSYVSLSHFDGFWLCPLQDLGTSVPTLKEGKYSASSTLCWEYPCLVFSWRA